MFARVVLVCMCMPPQALLQTGLLDDRQWIGEAVPLDEPERTLKLRAAGQLCSQALAAFPAVLARAQLLPLAEQVGCACLPACLPACLHASVQLPPAHIAGVPGLCNIAGHDKGKTFPARVELNMQHTWHTMWASVRMQDLTFPQLQSHCSLSGQSSFAS